jgi:hypothetical protein
MVLLTFFLGPVLHQINSLLQFYWLYSASVDTDILAALGMWLLGFGAEIRAAGTSSRWLRKITPFEVSRQSSGLD